MSYEVTFERRPAFIYATVTGTNSVDAVAGYLLDILAECQRADCYRVLIDEHLEGPRLAVDEVYSVASEGAMNALGVFHAIAFVDEQMGEMAYFAETVATNRGMPVRAFATIAHAEEWLNNQLEGPDEQAIFNRDDPEEQR